MFMQLKEKQLQCVVNEISLNKNKNPTIFALFTLYHEQPSAL